MPEPRRGRPETASARALFRLWLPTVFGASMLVVEIPLVAAGAARSADGARALAAIGIGMAILVVVNTPALAITALVVDEYDRVGGRALRRYTIGVGLAGTTVLLALAVPPGSALVDALFGLDPETGGAPRRHGRHRVGRHRAAARAGLGLRWMWLLLPLPALWVARAYLRGIVMAAEDTRWLSYAGLGHVLVLVGALLVLTGSGLSGVACAGIALTAGVAVETVVTAYGARPRAPTPRPASRGAIA
jgi:hypothetical protein